LVVCFRLLALLAARRLGALGLVASAEVAALPGAAGSRRSSADATGWSARAVCATGGVAAGLAAFVESSMESGLGVIRVIANTPSAATMAPRVSPIFRLRGAEESSAGGHSEPSSTFGGLGAGGDSGATAATG